MPRDPTRTWVQVTNLGMPVASFSDSNGYLQDGVGAHLLETAYDLQKKRPEYEALLNSGAVIEGTYDDHDFGRNDAGKHLSFK